MARASLELILALRHTADKLNIGKKYMWGHMGACNCGNLAQELTNYSRAEIHDYAMRGRGDWTEQAEAYCTGSNMPIEIIISELLTKGLTTEDLMNLEKLKDKEVLERMSQDQRESLSHNNVKHVMLYMRTWADLLEEHLLANVELGDLAPVKKEIQFA
jgi:hypothetical protein